MILTHTYTHFHAIDTVIHAVPLVTLVFAPEASVLHLGWACTKHLELHNKHTTPPDVTSTGYFNTKAFCVFCCWYFSEANCIPSGKKTVYKYVPACTEVWMGEATQWLWLQSECRVHTSHTTRLCTLNLCGLYFFLQLFFLSLHLGCNLFWVPWNYKFLLPCYGLCSSEFKTLSIWFFLMVQRSCEILQTLSWLVWSFLLCISY